jgi:hypothetical protein
MSFWPFKRSTGLLIPTQEQVRAGEILQRLYDEIRLNPDVHQVTFNIATDRLREFLGENSKIYYSFSQLDISAPGRPYTLDSAIRLLEAAIVIVQTYGPYEDLQKQLLRVNIRTGRRQIWVATVSTLVGALAANLGKIIDLFQSLLQHTHK